MYGGGCGCNAMKKGGSGCSAIKRGGGCGCNAMKKGGKRKSRKMMGGNCQSCYTYKGGQPVPAPLVGKPWSVDNTSGNYYADNKYPTDVQMNTMSSSTNNDLTNSSMVGLSNNISSPSPSYGGRKTRHRRRGGGIIPQDLVNFGDSFRYGLGSTITTFQGVPRPTNPLPYLDQLKNTPTAGQLRY